MHTLPLECQSALGVESGAIPDSQMSASSQWDGNHAAKQGRLFFKSTTKASSWSAKTNNANQWLQVHLTVYTRVTRVASQGRHAVLQWVTKYKLQYSIDGNTFHYFIEAGQSADKVKLTPGPQRQGSLFVKPRSTFTFTRGFSYITSILIYARKASLRLRPYARKNYATVEIHLNRINSWPTKRKTNFSF